MPQTGGDPPARACTEAQAPWPPKKQSQSIVPIVERIVFFIVSHCSCAGGFFAALSKPCIVNDAHFPLQIDCILLGAPPGAPAGRPGGWAGERRNGKMAERSQAEKPNNFSISAPVGQPGPKMAE
jgi:hypothetical protein